MTALTLALRLRPGVALLDDERAALTSDIVWLKTQSVTPADGSVQQVLAPKVYLARLGQGAVHPAGALITGADIRIEGDSVVNRGGTIGGTNTGRAVLVVSQDIVNQGGTIRAGLAMQMVARCHIALQPASSSTERDQRHDPTGTRFRQSASATTAQGTHVQSGADLSMRAGVLEAGDLSVIGSRASAQGEVN